MKYVVYEVSTGRRTSDLRGKGLDKSYRSKPAAEACKTRLVKKLGSLTAQTRQKVLLTLQELFAA